jgi:hypothetical protein
MNLKEYIQSEIKLQLNESVNWSEFYKMAKDTSGYNSSFEKKYGTILDRPHVKDALDKAKDFNSFMKFIKKFESVNEGKDVGHYERVGNQTIVDSNFVNYSKGVLPNSELVHLGMGDFAIKSQSGTITFERSGKMDGIGQDFVGRPHRMTDDKNGKLVDLFLKLMLKKKKAILSMSESVNEAITDGDVVIFKKQKGEVPKITYNSSRKQFAADFLSHTDYYKNLTDAIEDMQDAGFKIEKHIQTESEQLDEKYTGNPGDILRHKYDKNTEIELIEPTNRGWKVYQITKGKRKIAYFDKQDIVGDNALFESEQLDEKLITFSNRKPYGQIVFMAGGAASGKGFAIDNFIDAAGFKVRDVDEMKTAVGKLDQLGKFSIDDWFKKYASKLPEEDRAHVEEFVVGKGMSIADVANNLKDPNNVAALHYIVDAMGLKDKWIINMLSGKTNKETLPNLLFDITAKKVSSITDVIKPLVDAGYDPKNVHLIWVLTDYHLAVSNNKGRDRVVPDDILLGTHEGAAKTIWGILTKGLPKGLNGRIDVILNNRENTVTYKDSKGNEMKGAVKGFLSLPVKKQGGGTLPEKVWKELLYKWILDNGPKTIDLSKPLDRQMRK